ncbi:hypothetical protein LDO31_08605 [Luteimonas sp. XNQY3]|nr:hypothetical protein [Luteimonas sp. XNQY3]MCD9006294.1 hypothetical protein [Luteimonas sp. XNQY3]
MEKYDIRTAGGDAQIREGVVCHDVFTTGTTGDPLITVRSDREQAYIAAFFSRVATRRPYNTRLRGLEFTNPYHGHLLRIPGATHFHRTSIYDAGSFAYGRATLARPHRDHGVEPRCTILMGLEQCLRAFTLDTLALHPDGFPDSPLEAVVTYSQYLTDAWRSRLQRTWHAPVIDRFGVSEIFGGASQCLRCGWYHFEPFVIAEIVGAHSGNVIHEGCGLLALTALHPFQQAQPLIRYLTGDLVETSATASCRPGTTAMRPLGRARYGVPVPGTDLWAITPSSVLEAVDECTDIERTGRFPGLDQVRDPLALGVPKYRTRWSEQDGRLHIRLDIAIRPETPPDRRARVAGKVRERIIARNPRLASSIGTDSATLDVCPCDTLGAYDLIAQAHSGGVWSAS